MELKPVENTHYEPENSNNENTVKKDTIMKILQGFDDNITSLNEQNVKGKTKRGRKSKAHEHYDLQPIDFLLRMPQPTGKLVSAIAEHYKKFPKTYKITKYQDSILCGNTTVLALKLIGIDINSDDIEEYKGNPEDILDFVLSKYLLQEHYSPFQIALILAEFYDELEEIVDRDIEKTKLKGRNRRKEIVQKFNSSEFNLAEALALKNNYPEVFTFMKNHNKYTHKDKDDIVSLWKNRPDLYFRFTSGELKLHEAIYHMKHHQGFVDKNINLDQTEVLEYFNSHDYLTDVDKNDIKQMWKFRQDLFKALVSEELDHVTAIQMMKVNSPRWFGKLNSEQEDVIETDSIVPTHSDSNHLKKDYSSILDDEDDIYGDIDTTVSKTVKENGNIWNKANAYDEDPEYWDKVFEEEEKSNLDRIEKRKEIKRQAVALREQSVEVKSPTINGSKTKNEENFVDNIQNSIQPTDAINSAPDDQEAIDLAGGIEEHTGLLSKNLDFFIYDPLDPVLMEFKDSFFLPKTIISQEQLSEQEKTLRKLINEGIIHQHKKVKRNIGHIVFKFHEKDSREVKPKEVNVFLEKAICLYQGATELLSFIQTSWKDMPSDESRKIDAFKEVVKSYESDIKSLIFYQ
ncbi:MAG: hypothetical protein EPN82_09810 [Bacteroidetes bacterium]|nr:MAG: hypothetical protein EPN82_09810 [Bacteroidota bacterium]